MTVPKLISCDVGAPRLSGATEQSGFSVTITAGGVDIWGDRDEFHFAHTPVSGDFDLSVRILGLEMADIYTKAGLMLRASLESGAPHAMLLTFGDNQPRNKNNGALEFQSRLVADGECTGIYPPQPLASEPDFPATFPDHWLRLSRQGDTLTGSCSTDGKVWRTFCTHTQAFPDTALLGLAVTSHNEARAVRASFQNLTLTPGSNS
jgi:regulation of enolase protein 1 (concanavalin A-like superfamily)